MNVPWEFVEKVIEDIDEWIVDIKDVNPQIYREYTGADNECVLENLGKLIEKVGKEKVRIRVPHISEYNTDDDVSKSVQYIVDTYGIEPEVFDYLAANN